MSTVAHLAANARYRQTDKGRATQRRADAKRSARRVARHRERITYCKAFGCQRCGRHERGLHFHHRDPSTKRYTVAVMTNASDNTFWAEVAKCDVLCGPCHVITHKEMNA